MDPLGNLDCVFFLGSAGTKYASNILSTLDAFWVCDEFNHDASHSQYSVLHRYPSICNRISITRERSNESDMA